MEPEVKMAGTASSLARFRLTREGTVLLVIDVQDRLAAVMEDRERVIKNCGLLMEMAKLGNMPVIVTEQYPKGLGHTVRELAPLLPGHRLLQKVNFDCCREPSFLEMLDRGRSTVLVGGMEAHICVLLTCLGLLNRGFHVHVAEDAVCSRRDSDRRTALELMRDAGAVITTTETALFQLLEMAGTEEFRSIQRRIR